VHKAVTTLSLSIIFNTVDEALVDMSEHISYQAVGRSFISKVKGGRIYESETERTLDATINVQINVEGN
jgi:hypothetical protein